MKRFSAVILSLAMLLTMVGCGAKAEEPTGEKMTICIDNVFYHNTEIAVPVEPDESAIEYVEIPVGGDASVEAFARIQGGSETYLVCLIDGEWYKFIED